MKVITLIGLAATMSVSPAVAQRVPTEFIGTLRGIVEKIDSAGIEYPDIGVQIIDMTISGGGPGEVVGHVIYHVDAVKQCEADLRLMDGDLEVRGLRAVALREEMDPSTFRNGGCYDRGTLYLVHDVPRQSFAFLWTLRDLRAFATLVR